MYIFERYIISKILLRVLFTSALLLSPLWLIQALHFLTLVPSHHINILLFVYVTLLLLPSALVVILPLTSCLSIFSVYYELNIHFENIILSFCKFRPLTICRPAIVSGIICCFISYLLSLYLVPASWQKFHQYENEIRTQISLKDLPQGTFVNLSSNLAIYIKTIEENTADQLILEDKSNPESPIVIFSEHAELLNTKPVKIRLYNGTKQTLLPNKNLSIFKFNHLDYELPKGAKKYKNNSISDISTYELFSLKNSNNKYGVELANRITSPLYTLIYALIMTCALVVNIQLKEYFKLLSLPSMIALAGVLLFIPLQYLLVAASKSSEGYWTFMYCFPISTVVALLFLLQIESKRTLRAFRNVE